MRSTRILIPLVVLAMMLHACTKDTATQKTPTTPAASVDSTALRLIAGVWIINKVEYPKTATIWALAYDAAELGYSTMTLHADHTLAFGNDKVVTNTGTWSLSKDGKLLSLTYSPGTVIDTVGFVNPTTLQLTIPKQFTFNISFYPYYRETYFLKQ